MSSTPIFSIVTVCLNEAAGIRRTCESVCAQTHCDFEWIIIDGGSTDGTLDVLENYREDITHLISEPDEGLFDAMNKGARIATGRYLVFMNGGDTFHDAETLQAVADAPDADLLFGDMDFLCDTGERIAFCYPDRLPDNFLLRNMLSHQAAYFDRLTFLACGGYNTDFSIAADYELFVRLIEVRAVSTVHIPRKLAVFYAGGISNDARRRMQRKRENHWVRKTYFPCYRFSLKCLRQALRNRFVGPLLRGNSGGGVCGAQRS